MKWAAILLLLAGVVGIVITFLNASSLRAAEGNLDRLMGTYLGVAEGAVTGDFSEADAERAEGYVKDASYYYAEAKSSFNTSLIVTLVLLAGGGVTYILSKKAK